MRVVIFLIVMIISVIMWIYTERTVFWMYLGTLTLSCLAVFPISRILVKTREDFYKSIDIEYHVDQEEKVIYLGMAFTLCYIVICGSTTFAVWYGVPWLNTLVAAAVIPAWLLLTHSISSSGKGYDGYLTSTTHEIVDIETGVRRGPASERQVYENQHGAGSWEGRKIRGLVVAKWFFFLAFVGGLLYFGFYVAIGVLVVTAGIRALTD